MKKGDEQKRLKGKKNWRERKMSGKRMENKIHARKECEIEEEKRRKETKKREENDIKED